MGDNLPELPEPDLTSYSLDSVMRKYEHRSFTDAQMRAYAEEAVRQEREEVERLRNLAATVYAGLGAECNLPERWLDVLSAAANGEPFDTEDLLPFTYEPPAG